ncbi:MAG: hypothetical protein ACYC4L_15270 [Chloroflexota bacterium]
MSLAALCQHALSDLAEYSTHVVGLPLRPYQLEPGRAIAESVLNKRGLSLTVEMARQAGKNELSAQLEAYLLTLCQRSGGNIVKAAPTFNPQITNSRQRLERTLNNPWTAGRWRSQFGNQIRLGKAGILFFSAAPGAQVVGATASLALEFDEAQDVVIEKAEKDFYPMAATTNATRVYYGTAWDDRTLLQRQIDVNIEAEKKDGIRRHFAYPWPMIAEHNPWYARYVLAERDRLGESHPLFKTQYLLQTVAGEGRFLSPQQHAQIIGQHPRQHTPTAGRIYVAGVDIAGEDEADVDEALRAARPRKDSTVVTIAEAQRLDVAPGLPAWALRLVDVYWWTGRKHADQLAQLVDVLRNVWHVQRVTVDATGVGAGVASFLTQALGEFVVEQFMFSAPSKSGLGYDFLATVNAGRFKWYAADPSVDAEAHEWWHQATVCRYQTRAHNQLAFAVPVEDGHDDFLLSAALCCRASSRLGAGAPVSATVPPPIDYDDGRY